ncbi:MAG: outer membrane protein assembly factor BamD, partial [Chthoniobacteraceae bacterium]
KAAPIALLLLFAPGLQHEINGAIVYRSNEGWSVEGDPNSETESSAADLMRRAEELEAAGKSGAALDAYRALVKRYPLSVLAPKAQRKVGTILESEGNYDKAYDAYAAYLQKYQKGEDFESVVESMFKIANLFLGGEKKKLFGIKFAPSMERAREMFEGIVKRAPFSRWAPLAQFNIGQALEKQGKYPEAIAAYQIVTTRYRDDAIADDAQYQIGYVRLREFREGSYDQAGAAKARESFEDFINRYPNSEKIPQAQENIKQLEGGSAKGQLDIAKFYDKTKSYRAAVIYYNDIIKAAPDSEEATYAKTRIEELKSKYGEDALRSAPEKAETGAKAAARRKLQAQVETISRPDYVGPPVKVPEPDEVAPGRPRLRTSPLDPVPPVEPPLPGSETLPDANDLPSNPN